MNVSTRPKVFQNFLWPGTYSKYSALLRDDPVIPANQPSPRDSGGGSSRFPGNELPGCSRKGNPGINSEAESSGRLKPAKSIIVRLTEPYAGINAKILLPRGIIVHG